MVESALTGNGAPMPWKRNLAFIWIGVFVGLLGANFVFPSCPFTSKSSGLATHRRYPSTRDSPRAPTRLSLSTHGAALGSDGRPLGTPECSCARSSVQASRSRSWALVQSVWQLILLRFLMGAFAGTMGAAAALVAAGTPRSVPAARSGRSRPPPSPRTCSGLWSEVVASSLGIRESFIFCAVLYAVAAALVYIFVREPKSRRPLNPQKARARE